MRLAVVGLPEGTGCVVKVAERTLDYSAPRVSPRLFQASIHRRCSLFSSRLQHHSKSITESRDCLRDMFWDTLERLRYDTMCYKQVVVRKSYRYRIICCTPHTKQQKSEPTRF